MFKKYFELSGYITKFRRMFDKKYSYEGDIHVWPDDHIEWNKIDEILSSNRVKRLHNYDYLLFRGGYKESIYREYYSKCSDMRCRVYKKIL